MSEKLLVPDIGEFENVEVIELLVKEGEEIEVELAKDVKVSIIRSTIVNVLSKTEPAKK